jgi:hypothetical protein
MARHGQGVATPDAGPSPEGGESLPPAPQHCVGKNPQNLTVGFRGPTRLFSNAMLGG